MSRKFIWVFLVAVVLMLPRSVHAQANFCDSVTGPSSGTAVVNASLTFKVCLGPNDINGIPLTSVTGWTVYDSFAGNFPVSTALTLTKGAVSTVTGLTFWSGPWVAPATVGAHSLQATATGSNSTGSAAESAKSTPFVLTLSPVPAPPAAPVKVFVGP